VPYEQQPIPNSPPPSFRSRASSPTQHLLDDDPLAAEAERTLADTFDSPSDHEGADSDDDEEVDDRQRLMRANTSTRQSQESNHADSSSNSNPTPRPIERRVTQLPVFAPQNAGRSSRVYGGGSMANDGVFANLSAKPSRGEDLDEKPPVRFLAA
jgi:hypothetical protein